MPRPETELLGRTALGKLPAGRRQRPGHRHVLRRRQPRLRDCHARARCAGLGERSHRRLRQLDEAERRTPRSRATASQVCQGDLFAGLADQGLEGTIDVVVCNPPYISTGRLAGDRAELLENEPREAFDGGPYGLSIHQRVMAEAPRFLKPGGWLLMEFGLGQHRQVKILIDRTKQFEAVELSNDAAGNPRVAAARLKAD